MKSRNLLEEIFTALSDAPAVLINGPRQAGKSTLTQAPEIHHQGRHYFTFDQPSFVAAAKAALEGFIAGLPT